MPTKSLLPGAITIQVGCENFAIIHNDDDDDDDDDDEIAYFTVR